MGIERVVTEYATGGGLRRMRPCVNQLTSSLLTSCNWYRALRRTRVK